MSTEDQNDKIEHQHFQLPEENLYMAAGFKQLAEGFTKAIDGEIPYKIVSQDTYKAIEFFGEEVDAIGEEDIWKGVIKIDEKLKHIDELEKYLQNTDFTSPAAKQLYEESLKEYRHKFLMFREAIWIEAEKGGYKLDPVKRYHVQDGVERLHKEIWGEPTFDSTKAKLNFRKNRVQKSYNEVKAAFESKKGILNMGEVYVVQAYLSILAKKYSLNEESIIKDEVINSSKLPSDSVMKQLLSPNQQALLFNAIIGFEQDLNEKKGAIDPKKWKTLINENSANMSANQSKEEVNLPGKGERELGAVIEKYGHEYALHGYTGMGSNTFLGPSFKGAKYLRHEEVHTYLKELVNNGSIQTLDDLKKIMRPTDEKTRAILACELFPAQEAEEILGIFDKLGLSELASMTPKKRVQRTKRSFPRDTPGHSEKDWVYLMEQEKVMDRYLESTSMEEFMEKLDFASRYKLNIDQYPLARQMEEELGIKDQYINKDHYTSRLLYRALEGNTTQPEPGTLDHIILQKGVDISELLSNVNGIIDQKS